jgi:hypothetical protein
MTRKTVWVAAKLAIGLAAPVFFLAVPPRVVESGPTLCLWKLLLGWECPGCGMTRALSHLAHGSFALAWRHNKLVVVVFPLLCFLWLGFVVRQVRILRQARAGRRATRILGSQPPGNL